MCAKSRYTHEHEKAAFLGGGGQDGAGAGGEGGDAEEEEGGDKGAPEGEVVYANKGVGAPPDPADGGVSDGGAEDAEHCHRDGVKAFGRGDDLPVGGVGGWGGGGAGNVFGAWCRVGDGGGGGVEDGVGTGDEDDAGEGDYAGKLLGAGEGLVDEFRACPASDYWGDEREDGRVG